MPDVGIHQKGEVDLPILIQKLKRELGGKAGAVGCFVGVVRDTSKDGKKVKYLHYECAEEAIKEFLYSGAVNLRNFKFRLFDIRVRPFPVFLLHASESCCLCG